MTCQREPLDCGHYDCPVHHQCYPCPHGLGCDCVQRKRAGCELGGIWLPDGFDADELGIDPEERYDA